jgi:uncharacterized membrane protein YvbJ
MYCPKCGQKLSEKDKFCIKCGTKKPMESDVANEDKKIEEKTDKE